MAFEHPTTSTPTKKTAEAPDVLIVGAGLIGLCCASALARRGLHVELWDQGPLAAASSAAGAGMLAPLVEAPREDRFFAVCRAARDLWPSWIDRLEEHADLDLDYDRSGALVVDEGSLIDDLVDAARRLDEPWQRLDPAAMSTFVPDMAQDVSGLWLPNEHRVDNGQVCRALIAELRHLGVKLRPFHGVSRVRPGNRPAATGPKGPVEAGRVLITAGAWSAVLEGLPEIPVRPIKGQMLAFDDVDWPFTGCVRGTSCYGVRRRGSRLLLGATVEDVGFDEQVTGRGLQELLSFACRFLPGTLDRPIAATWAGLRPGSPDHMPWIGPIDEGIFVAAGHFRNGILLAPWTGEAVADAICGKGLPAPADDLFDPHRSAVEIHRHGS